MCSRDFLLGISANDRGGRGLVTDAGVGAAAGVRGGRGRGRAVGFEDVEALQLLVQDGEGLELLGLDHLLLEPVLDLILLFFDQVLVVVVEMSGAGQGCMRGAGEGTGEGAGRPYRFSCSSVTCHSQSVQFTARVW